jgi:hypothetical protein
MKKYYIALGLGVLALLQGCAAHGADSIVHTFMALNPEQSAHGETTKEEAIVAADREMMRSGGHPSLYSRTPCSLSSGWLIAYDNGTEYVISKSDKNIKLSERQIPLSAGPGGTTVYGRGRVDKDTAVKLTRDDAVSVYPSIDQFKRTVCELPTAWRIIYEPEGDASGGGPDYVVDKTAPRIIYKQYSQ